jgi:hypothetical protein
MVNVSECPSAPTMTSEQFPEGGRTPPCGVEVPPGPAITISVAPTQIALTNARGRHT